MGPADTLASEFLYFAGVFAAIVVISAIIGLLIGFVSILSDLWRRGTWIFRIVFMILPAVVIVSGIVYGIVTLWIKYTYETSLVASSVFYFSTYFTGYRRSEDGKKEFLYRRGAYAQLSRCVFIAPWSPFIFVYIIVKKIAKLSVKYLFKY